MMDRSRAQLILDTTDHMDRFRYSFEHDNFKHHSFEDALLYNDGITKEEDTYIKQILMLMDDDKSYFDAVTAIAKGI